MFSKASEIKSRSDLIVLGTTCAKSYFPFNIESYLRFLEVEFESLIGEYDEYSGSSSYRGNHVDTFSLFNATSEATNNFTFYEKEGGTKSDVCNILFDSKRKLIPSETKWEDMKEWLEEAYLEPKDEFSQNIHSVMFDSENNIRKDINVKFLGIAVYSFVGAKKNHVKVEAKKIQCAEDKDCEYFGNAGDKFERELTLQKIFSYESDFGWQYIYIFKDKENHIFKWSTANGAYESMCSINARVGYTPFEENKTYTLKGSIKDHKEYNGVKQTIITHCKVTKDEFETHIFGKKECDRVEKEVAAGRKSSENYEDPFGEPNIA